MKHVIEYLRKIGATTQAEFLEAAEKDFAEQEAQADARHEQERRRYEERVAKMRARHERCVEEMEKRWRRW